MKKFIALCILAILITCTGCGKNTVYGTPGAGYKAINSIPGCTFYVPERFASTATAITRVSKNTHYDSSMLYSYKNGSDQYMMFQMNSFIILVQKNSNFNFTKENIEGDLENGNIMGVWFHKSGEDLTYSMSNDKGIGKIVIDATAEVTLTDELYDDFVGKFAYLTDGTDNWTIFVGCPGTDYSLLDDTRQGVISNVVMSLSIASETETEGPKYNVVVQGETISGNTVITVSDNSISGNHISDSTVSENTISSNNIVIDDNTLINNQQTSVKAKNRAYNSSIYSLLVPGEHGLLWGYDNEKSEYKEIVIELETLYTGNEAIKIIQDYCKSEDALYRYQEPPIGCEWHVIKYNAIYPNCSEMPYIDIKLCGVDGELLKHKGIPYPKRTYDINTNAIVGDHVTKELYCFYPVPRGCNEYVLECGDGSIEINELKSAYYLITY